jgi:multidrug efflux pump subunit AcrA (membrane-fusion protein)
MPRPGEPYTPAELAQKRQQELAQNTARQQMQQLQKARWLTAQTLADKAKAAGAWIYDPATKTWYTPEEFIAAFNQSYADHPLFHRVRLMNPVEGLNAGYKQLENLQARLLAFSKRIMAYLGG